MVGARKKWRATTSQVTARVIGMMSQAVARPDVAREAVDQLDGGPEGRRRVAVVGLYRRSRRHTDPPFWSRKLSAELREERIRGSAADVERPDGGARPPRRPGFSLTGRLLQPDLVLVVVLGDEVVVRPVREAVGHHEAGVLLLRVDDLLVELVLGRVRACDLVVRLQEAPVQLVGRLDDLDARGEQVLAGLGRLLLEPDEVVPVRGLDGGLDDLPSGPPAARPTSPC